MIQPSGAIVPSSSPSPLGLADQVLLAADLIVVLDGTPTRLKQAERYRQQLLPRATSSPSRSRPRPIGSSTARLQHRQAPAPQRIWIATDPDHTARAVDLARIALGSQGIRAGLAASGLQLLTDPRGACSVSLQMGTPMAPPPRPGGARSCLLSVATLRPVAS